MDKYEIAVLAEDYETKRMAFHQHQVMNTPTDPEERKQAMIAYHIAEAELLAAHKALERAKALST